jgi:hypothetical protein
VRIERCSATSETTPKTVAVSPPWFGNASAVRRESSNVRRLANTQPRAAGVSPPWFGNRPCLQGTENHVRRTPTAQSGAAGVSPPGYGSRACDGDRSSSGHYVRHARSDGAPRLAYANRSRRRSWWTHANGCKCAAPFGTGESFHNHGWLTLIAPGARRRSAEKYRHSRCTNARSRERRASARRGTRNRTGNGDRFSWTGSDYVHQARSDGALRLAHASRSWCTASVR